MLRFDDLPIDLTAAYGGSEQKRGVIYRNSRYMLKMSDRIQENQINNLNSSYSNSAISEYVCCHIVELIGLPVQSTLLGNYRRWSDYHNSVIDDVVVACKNFVDEEHTLVEFKQLANSILPSKMGKLPKLSDICSVFQENEYFTKDFAEVALQRYWDTFIIDALLGNFDRHGNNWGYLVNKETLAITLAPIYDCGSCLYPQISDNGISMILNSDSEIKARVMHFPKAALLLSNNEKASYYEYINKAENPDCDAALLRIVPKINLSKMGSFIDSVECLSTVRKEFYKVMLQRRFEGLLMPRYHTLLRNSKGVQAMNSF